MEKINIKCRTWHKGVLPSPIKLEIPGWAGIENSRVNGDSPQPWHCPPFVEGSTYGLELIYPFETECHVKNIDGKIIFDGDFTEENKLCKEINLPPFSSFAPTHFGMTSGLDIKVPENYVLRTEPHPAFYTDSTGTFPCCLAGHIQTYWWPRYFFVVFKNPPVGGTIIFKKNMPYGQVLIVPKKINYSIEEMDKEESKERDIMSFSIEKNVAEISKNRWLDINGSSFSDKYKQLSSLYMKKGYRGVRDLLFNMMYRVKLPTSRQEKVYKKCPIFKYRKK